MADSNGRIENGGDQNSVIGTSTGASATATAKVSVGLELNSNLAILAQLNTPGMLTPNSIQQIFETLRANPVYTTPVVPTLPSIPATVPPATSLFSTFPAATTSTYPIPTNPTITTPVASNNRSLPSISEQYSDYARKSIKTPLVATEVVENQYDVFRKNRPTLVSEMLTPELFKEWHAFFTTFYGNVKITLDKKTHSNKFYADFFKQISMYYQERCVLDQAGPEHALVLNHVSYTDRMDIITTSVTDVFQSFFNLYVEKVDRVTKINRSLMENTVRTEIDRGIVYFVMSKNPNRKRSNEHVPLGSVHIFNVSYIATSEIPLTSEDKIVHADEIKNAVKAAKASLTCDAIAKFATLSISNQTMEIHCKKLQSIKISPLNIYGACVDGTDKNIFAIISTTSTADKLNVSTICTNTKLATQQIVDVILKTAINYNPQDFYVNQLPV